MRKSLGLLSLALLLAAPAAAQEAWLIPYAFAWQPPVAGFNEVFHANGAPEARARHFGWGIELRSDIGGNFLFGPMFFTTTDRVETDSFRLSTGSTGLFGELAYRIGIADVVTIVPMVGVGGLNQKYHLRRATGDLSLEELLRSRESQIDVGTKMKLTGLAALELGFAANTKAGRFGVALRGGYLYSPFAPDWRSGSGDRVTGTPDVKLAGPFASVGLMLLPAAEVSSSTPGLK
ncbi:MAG: hypothetical protein R6X13_10600 [bacterium]